MGIKYNGMPGKDSGQGWRDGLHWFEEIDAWSNEYEKRYMVPDQGNHDTAECTTKILLWLVPQFAKTVGKQAVCVLMDDRLRKAMVYEQPPSWVTMTVRSILIIRRLILTHLALPRLESMRRVYVTDKKTQQGTYYTTYYDALPYYVQPTTMQRWGPGAWIRRLQGLPIPGDSEEYSPQGFKAVDLGPIMAKQGQKAMEEKVAIVGRMERPTEFKISEKMSH